MLLVAGDEHDFGWTFRARTFSTTRARTPNARFKSIGNAVVTGQNGHTLLRLAAQYGNTILTREMLARGADVDLGGFHSRVSPLATASFNNNYAVARLLLDRGARVNAQSNGSFTALHRAAERGHTRMTRLLLSRGAEVDVVNQQGDTPETRARKYVGGEVAANLLGAVHAAGGWAPYVAAPRAELLALRRALPELRAGGRATAPSSVAVHEKVFIEIPEDVFIHVFTFWRGARELDV